MPSKRAPEASDQLTSIRLSLLLIPAVSLADQSQARRKSRTSPLACAIKEEPSLLISTQATKGTVVGVRKARRCHYWLEGLAFPERRQQGLDAAPLRLAQIVGRPPSFFSDCFLLTRSRGLRAEVQRTAATGAQKSGPAGRIADPAESVPNTLSLRLQLFFKRLSGGISGPYLVYFWYGSGVLR